MCETRQSLSRLGSADDVRLEPAQIGPESLRGLREPQCILTLPSERRIYPAARIKRSLLPDKSGVPGPFRFTRWEKWLNAPQKPPANMAAVSLIELLITVAIILILSTLYFGPNTAGKQQALKRACQKNLEKIFVSMEIYANEHGGRFPQTPGARTSEEALDVLVPKYTSDPSPFICPGSKDGPLQAGVSLRGQRISYAYYMGRQQTNSAQVLMSDRQVDTQPKLAGQAVFSTDGKPPGNNHRKFGGNFLFCDGHTEMTPSTVPFALPLTNGEVLLNP